MSRRSYLTPAGESTLSKRNALLGTSHSNSSNPHLDPYGANSEGAAGSPYYANGNGGGATSRSPSPYGARPGSSASQYASNRTAEDLESQNDEELDGLGAKVKMLKDITISIGNEVRDSTKMLNGMNDTFDSTSGFLGGTFRRMNNMAARQGGRWWYWFLFLVLVFWVFAFRWLGIL